MSHGRAVWIGVGALAVALSVTWGAAGLAGLGGREFSAGARAGIFAALVLISTTAAFIMARSGMGRRGDERSAAAHDEGAHCAKGGVSALLRTLEVATALALLGLVLWVFLTVDNLVGLQGAVAGIGVLCVYFMFAYCRFAMIVWARTLDKSAC